MSWLEVACALMLLCCAFFAAQWYRVVWHTIRLAQEMTGILKRLKALESRGVLDVERHLSESPHLTLEAVKKAAALDGASLSREEVRAEALAALREALGPVIPGPGPDAGKVRFGDMLQGQRFLSASGKTWAKCGVDRAHLESDPDEHWLGVPSQEPFETVPSVVESADETVIVASGGHGGSDNWPAQKRAKFGDLAVGAKFGWRGEIWRKDSGVSADACGREFRVAFAESEEVTPC